MIAVRRPTSSMTVYSSTPNFTHVPPRSSVLAAKSVLHAWACHNELASWMRCRRVEVSIVLCGEGELGDVGVVVLVPIAERDWAQEKC